VNVQRPGLGWLVALCGLLLCACTPAKDREAQPDILLVLVTGLRTDTAGQPSAEAALLAPFEGQARRSFTAAYSQSISPPLSLGSLLTGIYPSALPQCGFVEFQEPDPALQPWCASLPSERATLPEALAAYGWRTAHVHPWFLEQQVFAERFAHDLAVGTARGELGAGWDELRQGVLDWWGEPDQPRFAVLQFDGLMGAIVQRRGPGPEAAQVLVPAEADYTQRAATFGQDLAALVRQLERSSDRPLLVVLTAPHGVDLGAGAPHRINASQLMAPALLTEETLHVPLHLLGSDVRSSASSDHPVELRALVPTLLGRVGATLPAGVDPIDLLSDDPGDHGPGLAYAEVGDMLALRQGSWLLRFRTMIHHSTALSTDLTGFLEHPVQAERPARDDSRFYSLFELGTGERPAPPRTQLAWPRALELRDAMIELRTGAAAPHPRATEPERLLELRMTASEGYW